MKRIKTTERQAKADAKSGNREANEQQRQRSTKQQGGKTNKKKEMTDIKKKVEIAFVEGEADLVT